MILNANGLALSFGEDEVFSGLSFSINRGDRCALVGVNGSGKTSLCRILAGELEPTEGHFTVARGVKISYLPQHLSMFPGGMLIRRVMLHSKEVRSALCRLRSLESSLEDADEMDERSLEEMLTQLANAQEDLESASFYSLRHRSEKILMGLGFEVDDLERELETLSGGWRMRAELAALLVSEPDILLLDEPTNHLDLDARLWLEEYLESVDAAVWVISHDPSFLDRTSGRILELEFGSMNRYGGNYSWYERRKQAEIDEREKQARLQAEHRDRLQRFVNRFKANPRKRFLVRSRLKMLERMEVIETHRSPRRMSVRFPEPPRSGLRVVQLSSVSKSYDRSVFANVDLTIEREDRIGIVGRNGEGKSTLSRIIAGIEPPTSGSARIGSNVRTGYYSQEVDSDLDPDLDLLEQIRSVSPASTEGEIRNWLGMFLFTGDDVFKRAGVLSGGEKSRLALARILFTPVNLLILDEPTNHLDIFSREVLKEGLLRYSGTFVLISHDEDLLASTVRRVLEVRGGVVSEFHGTFGSYLERRKTSAREALRAPDSETRSESSGKLAARSSNRDEKKRRRRMEAEKRRLSHGKRSTLEKRMRRVEEKLIPLEERLSGLERDIQDAAAGGGRRIVDLQKEHAYLSREVNDLRATWDRLAEEHGRVE